MYNLYKILIRVLNVIPVNYKKQVYLSSFLSVILLILDVFSIFLLIPLIVSLTDSSSNFIKFLSLKTEYLTNNKYYFISLIITFFLVKNAIGIFINKFQSNLIFKLGTEYSLSLSKHYLLSNYLTFKQNKKSSIIKDIIFIPNDFVSNVILSINNIISEIILLCIIGFIGFYYNYIIALLVIIVTISIITIYRKSSQKTVNSINKTRVKDFDKNISNLNNLLNGYLSIKSSNLINHFLDAFYRSNHNLNKSYAILHSKRINSSKQTEMILVLLLCAIFIALSLAPENRITPTLFLSIFASLIFKAVPSINKLNIALTNLTAHLYTLDIIERKSTKAKKSNSTSLEATPFNNQISIKNISFYYENKTPILNNLILTIKKGEFISIVGASGVGKTTLLNIIAGLITPNKGNIYLDDVKITNQNRLEYFNFFTYLTQKPFIYEGSISDNLFLLNNSHSNENINHILISLGLDKIINQFDTELETYIGADAGNLSAGQLQLICIARAILSNPKILILDEATNNLDLHAEIKTLNYLKSFAKKNNITLISVSHHIEATKNLYDRIIELH